MVRSSRRREVAALLARRDRDGLSLAALSAETGIPVGTLSWWSWKLRQESPPRSGFVEVSLTEDGVCEFDDAVHLVVETARGTRILLPVGVHPSVLRAVLDVVEDRC